MKPDRAGEQKDEGMKKDNQKHLKVIKSIIQTQTLYRARWNVDLVVESLAERRVYKLLSSLKREELEGLRRALDDPDVLSEESLSSLLRKLVEYNMVVDGLYSRDERLWVDTPPPERDPVLGVGRRIAWQTPLHREAVRRALSTSPPK